MKPRRRWVPLVLILLFCGALIAVTGSSGSQRRETPDTQAAAEEILERCRPLVGNHVGYAKCLYAATQTYLAAKQSN